MREVRTSNLAHRISSIELGEKVDENWHDLLSFLWG